MSTSGSSTTRRRGVNTPGSSGTSRSREGRGRRPSRPPSGSRCAGRCRRRARAAAGRRRPHRSAAEEPYAYRRWLTRPALRSTPTSRSRPRSPRTCASVPRAAPPPRTRTGGRARWRRGCADRPTSMIFSTSTLRAQRNASGHQRAADAGAASIGRHGDPDRRDMTGHRVRLPLDVDVADGPDPLERNDLGLPIRPGVTKPRTIDARRRARPLRCGRTGPRDDRFPKQQERASVAGSAGRSVIRAAAEPAGPTWASAPPAGRGRPAPSRRIQTLGAHRGRR